MIVWLQMAPAIEWKIASSPMNTTTEERIGASCNGLRIMRSMSTPMMKEMTITAASASQKFQPNWMSCHVRYVENIAISPCAKLRWSVDTKIMTSASATHA